MNSPAHYAAFPPPAADPGTALRVHAAGLVSAELDLLKAILVVLEERTTRPWRVAEAHEADLLLSTREATLGPRPGTVRGRFVREGEPLPGGDELHVALPLRVMSVLDALNAAHDRLARQRDAAPARQGSAVAVGDDGKSLAAALARMSDNRHEQKLRVRIVGFGTLYLCAPQRRYAIDFPAERLSHALEQHRYVLTAMSGDGDAAGAAGWRPLDDVLWRIGLQTPWEPAGNSGESRWRLRRWPDFSQLPHRPEHLQLCAVLAARPATLRELATTAALPSAEVAHFLHACELCGLIEAARDESPPPPAVAAAPPAAGLGGLFGRLRKRFGL